MGTDTRLLVRLLQMTTKPVLIGTWRDAGQAIRFYQKHGFGLTSMEEKDALPKDLQVPFREVVENLRGPGR